MAIGTKERGNHEKLLFRVAADVGLGPWPPLARRAQTARRRLRARRATGSGCGRRLGWRRFGAEARQLLDSDGCRHGRRGLADVQDERAAGAAVTAFTTGNPNSAGTLYWRFYEYPDKERQELTKQRDVVYIYTATRATRGPSKGTSADEEKATQEIVRRRRHLAGVVLREWLKAPRTVLFTTASR